jgi:sodium/potassium-transporting ATPase subunit alpha
VPDTIRRPIHDLPANEVFAALATSPSGLTEDEAARRLVRYGRNSVEARAASLTGRFLRQFTHFLAFLLWVAAVLAFLAEYLHPGEGMAVLGWAILGVILVNAIFAFIQEYKAERAVQALRELLPPHAWVLRAGRQQQIPRTDIVPGDVLLLEEGEQIPADARLVDAVGMRVDNSSLTGRIASPATHGRIHCGRQSPRHCECCICRHDGFVRPWSSRRLRHRHANRVR